MVMITPFNVIGRFITLFLIVRQQLKIYHVV